MLKLLDREPVDLILMDIQMPDMDGFEATAAIRSQDGLLHRHTPIIALTAHALPGDGERCLRGGMDDYLSKPVVAQELYEKLKKWLEKPMMTAGSV